MIHLRNMFGHGWNFRLEHPCVRLVRLLFAGRSGSDPNGDGSGGNIFWCQVIGQNRTVEGLFGCPDPGAIHVGVLSGNPADGVDVAGHLIESTALNGFIFPNSPN